MPRARAQPTPTTLAVVDMGSNSFRLELGRVEGDQIFRLDTVRETLRIGAALARLQAAIGVGSSRSQTQRPLVSLYSASR